MLAKILVVDDEPNIGDLIYRRFRKQTEAKELQLLFAYDGLEALDKLRADPSIDMLITDIEMPNMDGLTLLSELNGFNPNVQTVVMSSYSDIGSIRLAMNLGAFDYLIKPIDFQVLEITIAKTLHKVREIKENQRFRLQKEAELCQAEAKCRSIFENAVEGIFQATPEGRYISVNPAIVDMLGYDSPADMIANVTNISEQIYVNPELRTKFKRILTERNEIKGFEYQVYRRDRSTIWISENSRAVSDPDGNILYYEGFVEDITERVKTQESLQKAYQDLELKVEGQVAAPQDSPIKLERFLQLTRAARQTVMGINRQLMAEIAERQKSEVALREAEEKYRSIFENAAEGIFQVTPDGQYISANPKLASIYGYSSLSEMINDLRVTGQQIHVDPIHTEEFNRILLAEDRISGFECQAYCRDGKVIWTSVNARVVRDESDNILYYEGNIQDITSRKAAEEALQRSNSLLQAQQQAAIDGILAADEQGCIVSYNRRFCEMWNVPEQVLNFADRSSQEHKLLSWLLANSELPEEFASIVERAYENPSESRREELYLEDHRVFDCFSGPVLSPNNGFYGMIWYFRDITERIKAEVALQAEKEKSERLLLNMLPSSIAERLKQDMGLRAELKIDRLSQTSDTEPLSEVYSDGIIAPIAENFASATVLFGDIVDFTTLSTLISPTELVGLLNGIFSEFDRLAELHGLEKIKTIGDAYMVVGGIPNPRSDHAAAIANMALDMQVELARFRIKNRPIFMRIGINTGPVIAGVIGTKKFIYDLWGDTVNIANRMESTGVAKSIQVTQSTYEQLKDRYNLEQRGLIQVKGKGEMMTYLLKGRKAESHQPSQ